MLRRSYAGCSPAQRAVASASAALDDDSVCEGWRDITGELQQSRERAPNDLEVEELVRLLTARVREQGERAIVEKEKQVMYWAGTTKAQQEKLDLERTELETSLVRAPCDCERYTIERVNEDDARGIDDSLVGVCELTRV